MTFFSDFQGHSGPFNWDTHIIIEDISAFLVTFHKHFINV